jgi:hypothetical protein
VQHRGNACERGCGDREQPGPGWCECVSKEMRDAGAVGMSRAQGFLSSSPREEHLRVGPHQGDRDFASPIELATDHGPAHLYWPIGRACVRAARKAQGLMSVLCTCATYCGRLRLAQSSVQCSGAAWRMMRRQSSSLSRLSLSLPLCQCLPLTSIVSTAPPWRRPSASPQPLQLRQRLLQPCASC